MEPTLNGKTFALLIGISRYQNSAIPPLHFADRDAESFRDYLMSARGGALSSQQLQLLLNENATRERIENGIANLVRGKGNRENTLIVFVAAHGTMLCTRASGAIDSTNVACDGQTQQPFILTFDADPSDGKTDGHPDGGFSRPGYRAGSRFRKSAGVRRCLSRRANRSVASPNTVIFPRARFLF